MLIDAGWLSSTEGRLTDFEADRKRFPHGLADLVRRLRYELGIPHVGVWQTLQGDENGIDPESSVGKRYRSFAGANGKYFPDPHPWDGPSFYEGLYSFLCTAGVDLIKVDYQASTAEYTEGLMALFTSGEDAQRTLQEAARKYFPDNSSDSRADGVKPQTAGVNVINCMALTLEHAFNWRFSNLARNSDDYFPDVVNDAQDHVFQNAYNSFWTSNFAYPDWDMFESHQPDGEFHAVTRAISGGPVYITDAAGKEHPEILSPFILSNGRLLMLDGPGQVTPDTLLRDPSLEPIVLKVSGGVSRPGYRAVMVAAFNVNKTAEEVTGELGGVGGKNHYGGAHLCCTDSCGLSTPHGAGRTTDVGKAKAGVQARPGRV